MSLKFAWVYKLAEKGKMWIVTRDADFQNYYRFIAHDIQKAVVKPDR